MIKSDTVVWIHDYHLIPMARELRRLGVTNPIGFFLHIPWPARQLVTTLPQAIGQLVEALFDYDLVGFQTRRLAGGVRGLCGAMRRGAMSAPTAACPPSAHSTRAAAFPIGIDAARSSLAAVQSVTAGRMYDRMAASTAFRSMIVGVDRLDYSKGLEERFAGIRAPAARPSGPSGAK